MAKKMCWRCCRRRLTTAFGPDKKTKDGLFSWCRECVKEYHHERDTSEAGRQRSRDKYHADPVKARDIALKVKYGITRADYDRMLAEQHGLCAVCQRPQSDRHRTMCVDHCHKTGRVRGLLCGPCNRTIGYLDGAPGRLQSAVAYLARNL